MSVQNTCQQKKGREEVIPFLQAIKWLLDQFSEKEGGKQILSLETEEK